MTRRFLRSIVLGIPFIVLPAAVAAETLPKAGTWARYYVYQKYQSGVERSYRQTIRFLGTVTENGEKHRWVEFVNVGRLKTSEGKPITEIYRLLVPEKVLRESTNPLRQFVRGWWSQQGAPRKSFETLDLRRMRHNLDQYFGPSLVWLPGLSKSAKATKNSRTVHYQNGQLNIEKGHRGTHMAVRRTTPPVVYSWKTSYEIWRHKSVAMMAAGEFRTVLCSRRAKDKEKVRYTTTFSYTIEAWGSKGESSLPPAK